MKAKSAKEMSEEEVRCFLEKSFGVNDIESNPKVGKKKADFRIRSIDAYVEVHAIKNIAEDQLRVLSVENNVTQVEFNEIGRRVVRDRIANKLLHECTQLPDGKQNLVVTKTEGFFLSPDDVIDAIIGEPHLLINKENMQTSVGHGVTAFRTEEELQQALQKISAMIAYKRICEHGKLHGIIGNNKNNAKVPFDDEIFAIFHELLCDKCA